MNNIAANGRDGNSVAKLLEAIRARENAKDPKLAG
jgi:hypothetical protein